MKDLQESINKFWFLTTKDFWGSPQKKILDYLGFFFLLFYCPPYQPPYVVPCILDRKQTGTTCAQHVKIILNVTESRGLVLGWQSDMINECFLRVFFLFWPRNYVILSYDFFFNKVQSFLNKTYEQAFKLKCLFRWNIGPYNRIEKFLKDVE